MELKNASDNNFGMKELLDVIWKSKYFIIGVTALFAVASVIYALAQENIYRSQAVVVASDENPANQMGGLGNQLGGLATLAGINLTGTQTDQATIALEILKSRKFIHDFVERHDILPELMAAESWNPATNELKLNDDKYDVATQQWLAEESDPTPRPTSWEYVPVFRDLLTIEQDRATGIINLSLEHLSATVAERWLSWLIRDINNEMRARDIREAQRSLEFLHEELNKTTVSNVQQVFYQLMEKQTQTIMLANVRPEYVFQVIDPPVVPETKYKPSRAMICILGTFLGGFIAVLLVLIRYFVKLD